MLNKTLRHFAIASGLLLPLFSSNIQAALADQRDFTVHNHTNYDIIKLYVSDSRTGIWEENLIPRGSYLPSGNYDSVYFHGSESSCVYDIKAVFRDGDVATKYNINLCRTTDFTFNE